MNQPRRTSPRRLLALGLAALSLLLGGCVYLRLLELRLQLNRFEKNFALRTDDGLAILCHFPVIRSGDIRWFGVAPESVDRLGHAERWHVRLVKQLPPGVAEPTRYDLLLDFGFADDRMNRIAIPERYFAAMPKAFLVGVIRSFGRSEIDRSRQAVETSVSAPDVASARPKLAALTSLLGAPTERRNADARTILRYRYAPASAEPHTGVFDMILHFDPRTGELQRWQAVTPRGKFGVAFAPRPPA
jgi:hypothetical protein